MRKKVKLPDQDKGIRCPKCNCADMRRESGWNIRIGRRRKRICRNCGHYVYTLESVDEAAEDKPAEGESA